MMTSSIPSHKRPRLSEEGESEYVGVKREHTERTLIVLHYNNKQIPLSLSVSSPANAVEGAMRVVCELDARTAFYVKNERGEVCVIDGSIPAGDYTVVTTNDNLLSKLPFFGARNIEKLRECIISSYSYISHELPSEVHQHIFTFLAPIDLLNAGKVCKAWHAISNDPELWKKLYVINFIQIENREHTRELADPQMMKLGWKNVFMVSHLFGACSYEIRAQFMEALKTLLGKSILEYDMVGHQSATVLGALDRFVVIVTIHLPLLSFRTSHGMITLQLALPSTAVQLSCPFNLWQYRTSSPKQTIADITATHFKSSLDGALEKMRRMIDGTAAREKMTFTKHTIPVFIPLPAITSGPAGNTSNVAEKIIFCIDLCSLERNPFVGQRCDKDVGLLDVVKLGVRTFVDVKMKMNTANQFAICTLTEVAEMYHNFTNNIEEFAQKLDDLIPHGRINSFDMSSLFSTLLKCVERDSEKKSKELSVYRCVFIYSRSDSMPTWAQGFADGRKLLADPKFYFDVLYLHEKPTANNQPQEVFDALTDVYNLTGTSERINSSYYCENSTSISRHFLCWAQLMAYPLQRPQQVENLPIVPYPEGFIFQ